MSPFTEGMLGMALVALAFLVGMALGKHKAEAEHKDELGEWIEDNACYLCQEKHREMQEEEQSS